MEYDRLNEIITGTVGTLFRPQAPKLSDKRNNSSSSSGKKVNQLSKNISSTSIDSAATSTLETPNTRHAKENSIKINDISATESDVSLSRDDQSIFRSPNQSIQIIAELGDSGNLKLEATRPTLKELSIKQYDNRKSPIKLSIDISKEESKIKKPIPSENKEKKSAKTTEKQKPTLEQWVIEVGPRRLEEALKNLKLDLNQLQRINLGEVPLEELLARKKAVKDELKRYDAAFYSIYKRQPERNEKEAMRPLYVYYKRLKQQISNCVEESKSREVKKTPSANSSIDSQSKQQKSPLRIDGSKMSAQNTKGSPALVKSKKYESLKRKFRDLEAEKHQLREKMRIYQEEFIKNNNRKIRYHADIEPVEADYQRYKIVKSEMAKLEMAMRQFTQ